MFDDANSQASRTGQALSSTPGAIRQRKRYAERKQGVDVLPTISNEVLKQTKCSRESVRRLAKNRGLDARSVAQALMEYFFDQGMALPDDGDPEQFAKKIGLLDRAMSASGTLLPLDHARLAPKAADGESDHAALLRLVQQARAQDTDDDVVDVEGIEVRAAP